MSLLLRARGDALAVCTPELGADRLSFRFEIQPDGHSIDFAVLEEKQRGSTTARCLEDEITRFQRPAFSGDPYVIDFYLEEPTDVR